MKTMRFSTLALGAAAFVGLLFTGCLTTTEETQLTLKMKVSDMDNVSGAKALHKGSVIKLKKLVITLTSNFSGDAVMSDTIIASDTVGSRFSSGTSADQAFSKAYAIKPLRNWTVVVKTFDTRDSLIHKDSVVALKLLAGETRAITLDLAARYVMYQVKFSVPDSLRSTVTQQAQRIIINRFVMKVDSAIAIDSSSPAGFAGGLAVHTADFDYILANTTPDVTIQFYGHSAGTNDTLLFEVVIHDVNPEVEQPPIKAVYVGPGASDGGGAITNLVINIGKVNTVVFNTNLGEDLPFKRAAR